MTVSLALLLLVSWISGIIAAEAGMREAEETSRREHLKEMREYR